MFYFVKVSWLLSLHQNAWDFNFGSAKERAKTITYLSPKERKYMYSWNSHMQCPSFYLWTFEISLENLLERKGKSRNTCIHQFPTGSVTSVSVLTFWYFCLFRPFESESKLLHVQYFTFSKFAEHSRHIENILCIYVGCAKYVMLIEYWEYAENILEILNRIFREHSAAVSKTFSITFLGASISFLAIQYSKSFYLFYLFLFDLVATQQAMA